MTLVTASFEGVEICASQWLGRGLTNSLTSVPLFLVAGGWGWRRQLGVKNGKDIHTERRRGGDGNRNSGRITVVVGVGRVVVTSREERLAVGRATRQTLGRGCVVSVVVGPILA